MSLKENVINARIEAGLSQPELAKAAGVSQQLISQIEAGVNQTTRKLPQIAKALGKLPSDLDPALGGGVDASAARQPNASSPRPIEPDYSRETIPVFGSAMGGPDGRFEFNGQEVDRIAAPPGLRGTKDAYAVYVVGSSMEPRYYEGETVYLHPGKPVRPGDFVLLQLKPKVDGDPYEGVVKRLVSRGTATVVVSQFNPPIEITFATAEVRAIHKIVMGGE